VTCTPPFIGSHSADVKPPRSRAEAIVRLLVANGLCAARVELLEPEPDGGLSLQVNGNG